MIADLPDHFDWYLALGGVLLALIVVGIGAAMLVRDALAFKKRLEGYKTLPFAPVLELTRNKTNSMSRSLQTAPQLVERAQNAIAALDAAKTSSQESARLAIDYVRALFSRR